MTDTWLRFAAVIISQAVILAGLFLNRRQISTQPQPDVDALVRIEQKVEDLQGRMLDHLDRHQMERATRSWR
jgi:hypothetical protein